MTVTIAHVYDDYESAKEAYEDLKKAHYSEDNISIVGRGSEQGEVAPKGAPTGATLGGVAGAGAGLLAGLGLIIIPGIGPIVAAGVIATTLAGTATGALAGGLLGALVEYGISKDQASVYAEAVRRGGSLVSVQADERKAEEADSIMRHHNPIDMEERERRYRESGWTEYDPNAPVYTDSEIQAELNRYGQIS
jgi:uncharacterized membrane protein